MADSREARWRLVLGQPAEDAFEIDLDPQQLGMDRVLEALYDAPRQGNASPRQGNLGPSSPSVARWLGDIRSYFPASVVQVMQKDALDRLQLRQMLLEPELLEQVQPDVNLAATLIALKNAIPARTKQTARHIVRRVADDLERRLRNPLQQAVRGALQRALRTRRPSVSEIDWDRTIRKNLQHYVPEHGTICCRPPTGRKDGLRRTDLRSANDLATTASIWSWSWRGRRGLTWLDVADFLPG